MTGQCQGTVNVERSQVALSSQAEGLTSAFFPDPLLNFE